MIGCREKASEMGRQGQDGGGRSDTPSSPLRHSNCGRPDARRVIRRGRWSRCGRGGRAAPVVAKGGPAPGLRRVSAYFEVYLLGTLGRAAGVRDLLPACGRCSRGVGALPPSGTPHRGRPERRAATVTPGSRGPGGLLRRVSFRSAPIQARSADPYAWRRQGNRLFPSG